MKLLSWLADLLWPPRCPFCKELLEAKQDLICPDCQKMLARLEPGQRTGDWFSGCLWVLPYEDSIRQAILDYKFQGKYTYAEAFGQVLSTAIAAWDISYDCLSWVPVSRERRRQRGYDQAELLCRAAGARLGQVPIALLVKNCNNPAQSTLDGAAARQDNVRNVYTALDPSCVQGKRILLIDDIVTTGSTLAEASRVLLLAGASSVHCAALAGRSLLQQGDKYVESVERPGH